MHTTCPTFGLIIIGDEILSGTRQDKHLQNTILSLKQRGLKLSWVKILGDDLQQLTLELQQSFSQKQVVFCCGGIGATPDDYTRQAVAQALNTTLERHPQAAALIEARFADAAYPHRIQMADFPTGSDIIPNPINQVAGFSIQEHFFMPGFPQMAQPMLEWVLDTHYTHLSPEAESSMALYMINAKEGEWVDLMQTFSQTYPQLKLFSLPSYGDSQTPPHLLLGFTGNPQQVEAACHALKAAILQRVPNQAVELIHTP